MRAWPEWPCTTCSVALQVRRFFSARWAPASWGLRTTCEQVCVGRSTVLRACVDLFWPCCSICYMFVCPRAHAHAHTHHTRARTHTCTLTHILTHSTLQTGGARQREDLAPGAHGRLVVQEVNIEVLRGGEPAWKQAGSITLTDQRVRVVTHSLTCSPTHSVSRSPTRTLSRSLAHPLSRSLARPLATHSHDTHSARVRIPSLSRAKRSVQPAASVGSEQFLFRYGRGHTRQ